jgi:enoyl-CoA hydratase
MGQGEPIEQAIAIMMEAHWRSAVHPDRAEGIGAFNEDREPTFADPDHRCRPCGLPEGPLGL